MAEVSQAVLDAIINAKLAREAALAADVVVQEKNDIVTTAQNAVFAAMDVATAASDSARNAHQLAMQSAQEAINAVRAELGLPIDEIPIPS